MLLLAAALLSLLSGCESIVDPRSVLTSLESYSNFTANRKPYFDLIRDYPYGDGSLFCTQTTSTPGGPKDAHHIRPSDVKVLAAIGDSLTAGREALSEEAVELGTEYRGIAFDAGSDANLTVRATLPNILSYFSPSLIGGSHGVRKGSFLRSSPVDNATDFNVAVSGSTSSDILQQAIELERRMKSSGVVNMEEDWKLITLFIGSNDLCNYGSNGTMDYSAAAFVSRVSKTLEYIKTSIPRSFVNLIPPFNVFVLQDTHEDQPFCELAHRYTCPSLFSLSSDEGKSLFREYSEGLLQLPSQFNSPSFAVTINNALAMDSLPRLWGTPHYGLLAIDCFHFSGFTHDVAAKLIWQNLLKPEHSRRNANDFGSLQLQGVQCPTEMCPYLQSNLTDCASSKAALRMLVDENGQAPAGASSHPVNVVFFVVGAIIGCSLLAVGTIATIVRFRRRYKRRLSERTPLLTAHYYESIF